MATLLARFHGTTGSNGLAKMVCLLRLLNWGQQLSVQLTSMIGRISSGLNVVGTMPVAA